MNTTGISSSPTSQELQTYLHQRKVDLQQLGKALTSGNLGAAQQAFKSIVTLGQNGPFANGEPFLLKNREQDFQAIGQSLQAGDLASATLNFDTLVSTFVPDKSKPPVSGQGTGPDYVVNLSGNQ